jgi:hypothetical protein
MRSLPGGSQRGKCDAAALNVEGIFADASSRPSTEPETVIEVRCVKGTPRPDNRCVLKGTDAFPPPLYDR